MTLISAIEQARGRLPWWASGLLGVAGLLVGGLLAVRPFQSLTLLVWLTIGGLLLTGLQLATANEAGGRPWVGRLVGLLWVGAALLAALWPGLTIRSLALIAGVALLVGGALRLVTALLHARDERLLLGLEGLSHLVFGVLALALPAVTALLLAIAFGLYLLVLGVRQVAAARAQLRRRDGMRTATRRQWPYLLRLGGAVAGALAALGTTGLVLAVRAAQPSPPGPFYTPPSPLPIAPAGTILRTEPVPGFYTGANAYRVLYLSTGYDGAPTAVSGLIIVPLSSPPPGGRKVVAWTHGTVGVAKNCAPSLIDGPRYGAALPGLGQLLDAGYVVAATDYQGLGTAGPHPYLVGASAGANALDNVRAAVNLPEAAAGSEFVVWGESQGGHTALFTGQLAASYAPELLLRGVIASAPASDLVSLFKTKTEQANAVGNILIAMALTSWAEIYGVGLDDVVYPSALPLTRSIAANCIQNADQIQASIPSASLLNMIFLRNPPWELAPWNQLLAENTPGGVRTDAPVLIAQGSADQVISPGVQEQFAARLCNVGTAVEYRTYVGIGHLTIAHDTEEEMVAWIGERFAGALASTTCRATSS